MKCLITFALITFASVSNAQELNKSIKKDSLMTVLVKDLPVEIRADVLKQYQSDSEQDKGFLLFVASMPRSSKKLQIKNIDSNYANISRLKSEYSKLVPSNTAVSIEFNPANTIFNIKESIDLKITTIENKETKVSQEWNLEFKSPRLEEMLKSINWNETTLRVIKKLLNGANCVSVENGETFEIGFARSGLGKYSYLVFNNDLSADQIQHHNDGCNFIFYKKNIVLEYDGGAAGPQCFPDK